MTIPPSSRRLPNKRSLLLASILVLAFALRLLWTVHVDVRPDLRFADDPLFYDYSARAIAAGKGYLHLYDKPTAQWPPGYSLILAGIYKGFGHSIPLVKLVNVFAGAATCLLLYLLAKRVFSAAVGLTAALIFALFPSQVFASTLVMTETLTAFLTALLLYLVLRLTLTSISWRRAALIGAAIGVASMIRGETVLLALPLIAVWAVAYRSWRTGLRYGAIALAATALVIMPWVVRNWLVLGYPVVISTGSAENLIAGHWQGADGLGSFVPILQVRNSYPNVDYPAKERLVYKEQTRRAVDFALHHPLKELQLIPKKLYYFYRRDDVPLTWIQQNLRPLSSAHETLLRSVANVYYWAALALALAGAALWFSLRDPRRLLLLVVVLYYSVLFGFVFVGEPRHHVTLIPIIAVFAAVSLVWLGERARRMASRFTPSGAAASGDGDASSSAGTGGKT